MTNIIKILQVFLIVPSALLLGVGNLAYWSQSYPLSSLFFEVSGISTAEQYRAEYNLASSLYRQEKYAEAAEKFQTLTTSNLPQTVREKAFYNSGNSLAKEGIALIGSDNFQARQLILEAITEYEQALQIDPQDQEAIDNIAYLQKLLIQSGENNVPPQISATPSPKPDSKSDSQQDQIEQDNQKILDQKKDYEDQNQQTDWPDMWNSDFW
ncbi:MAG: tetratricopeptide repeat protein [bacterium]